jgi:hypothetical protein
MEKEPLQALKETEARDMEKQTGKTKESERDRSWAFRFSPRRKWASLLDPVRGMCRVRLTRAR